MKDQRIDLQTGKQPLEAGENQAKERKPFEKPTFTCHDMLPITAGSWSWGS